MLTPYGELPNRLAVGMSLAEQHEWLVRPVRRRTLLKAGVAGVALPLLWQQSARAADAASVFGVHLAYGSDPTSEMVVGFACATAVGRAQVVATSGSDQVTAEADVQSVRGTATLYGRATLHSLRPGTRYAYDIIVDGNPVASGTLRTAQTGPHPFRFTAFGDQGVDRDATALLSRLQQLDPQFHVFAGDLSYADASGVGGVGDHFRSSLWDAWLQQNQPSTAAIPWNVAVGNHEMEPGFDLHGYAGVLARVHTGGASPLSVPTASSYQVGSVGFVGLDGNDVSYEIPANRGWTAGAQTAWLEATLAAMRATGSGIEFIVVYLHNAVYSTNIGHGGEGGVRESWVPLFDRHEVDLVISGHAHCYERTLPLRAGRLTSTDSAQVTSSSGTTYITAGGGGATANLLFFNDGQALVRTSAGPEPEKAPWSLPAARTGDHAVLCIDVTPPPGPVSRGRLTIRAITASGAVIDQVTLQRSVPPVSLSASAPTSQQLEPGALTAPGAIGGAAALVVIAGAAALQHARNRDAGASSEAGSQPASPGRSPERPSGPPPDSPADPDLG